MKIIQINTVVNSGSTGKIAEQLGEIIIKEKFESFIAYSRLGLPSRAKIIKVGNKLDMLYHVLYTRLFDKHGFGSKKATKNLIKKIDLICPDIIHLHNIHGYYINIDELFIYLNKIKIPVIWTFHDCWPFTGHCSYFDRVDCNKWKVECFDCPMTRFYPASLGIDNSKNNFKKKKELFTNNQNLTIISPSNWLKALIKQSFFKNNKIITIHNGVDLDVFKPQGSNNKFSFVSDNQKLILGVASIWDKRKGLDDFLRLSKFISKNYMIVLVGLSKKEIIKMPSNIIGIQRTENIQELVNLYERADVYVNPTYSDNFPTTNIEALACGTPVLTYSTGGSPEAIDETTGIVVNAGDIKGLIVAIQKIIKGIETGEKYTSRLCRSRAEKLFNKDDRYGDYIKLYKNILLRQV